jgi:hypothetical protein
MAVALPVEIFECIFLYLQREDLLVVARVDTIRYHLATRIIYSVISEPTTGRTIRALKMIEAKPDLAKSVRTFAFRYAPSLRLFRRERPLRATLRLLSRCLPRMINLKDVTFDVYASYEVLIKACSTNAALVTLTICELPHAALISHIASHLPTISRLQLFSEFPLIYSAVRFIQTEISYVVFLTR